MSFKPNPSVEKLFYKAMLFPRNLHSVQQKLHKKQYVDARARAKAARRRANTPGPGRSFDLGAALPAPPPALPRYRHIPELARDVWDVCNAVRIGFNANTPEWASANSLLLELANYCRQVLAPQDKLGAVW